MADIYEVMRVLQNGRRSQQQLANSLGGDPTSILDAASDGLARGWIRHVAGPSPEEVSTPAVWYELTPRGEQALAQQEGADSG